MPSSIYKLVSNNPDLKKLAPSTLEIGTYTTNTVKIVGSCVFYQFHPDTKKLHEVTSFVATQDGSVLYIMCYNTCTWIDTATNKIRLFATKS